jgi:hypothetical protein
MVLSKESVILLGPQVFSDFGRNGHPALAVEDGQDLPQSASKRKVQVHRQGDRST